MRISDWSSDVCSSDLSWRCCRLARELEAHGVVPEGPVGQARPAERVLAFFDPLFRGTTAVLELDHAPGRPAQDGVDEADAGIQVALQPLDSGHSAACTHPTLGPTTKVGEGEDQRFRGR